MMKTLSNIAIKFIKSYRYFISPLFGNSCRYFPTCSEYSIEAFEKFGFLKAILMSTKRILSCHPFRFLGGSEGYDPVDKKNSKMKK